MFSKKDVVGKDLIVVDPGKHTTKAIRRDYNTVDFRTKMFNNSNELETSIVNELSSNFAFNINHQEAPYILQNKGIKIKGDIDRDSIKIVNSTIDSFIEGIVQEVKKNGHDLDLLDVVFVGGTSELIQDHIKTRIKHVTITKEAQWAAVEGSLQIGAIKYGETKS